MRKQPSIKTIKKLFALSGNLCAFPGCTHKLFDEDDNFIGEICHIEAANRDGERYNPNQTQAQRGSFDNLIVFCRNHHSVTNDVDRFTIEKLHEMKRNHERRFKDHPYSVSQKSMEIYFSSFDRKLSEIAKSIAEIKTNTVKRYDLKVEFSTLIVPSGLNNRMLAITGMNIGELPITLSSWGFELPNKNYIIDFPCLLPEPVRFPYKLPPWESITVAMKNARVASTLKDAGYENNITLVGFFKDQIGNKYETVSLPFKNY
jgi:hypothetical protein